MFKGDNFKIIQTRVMVLVLFTSPNDVCMKFQEDIFNQLGPTADRHTVSRLTICCLTYMVCMLIDILYVDRDIVCPSTYSMSIGIHALMYLDRFTVCRSTYIVCMLIDILSVKHRHFLTELLLTKFNRE